METEQDKKTQHAPETEGSDFGVADDGRSTFTIVSLPYDPTTPLEGYPLGGWTYIKCIPVLGMGSLLISRISHADVLCVGVVCCHLINSGRESTYFGIFGCISRGHKRKVE